MNLQSLLTPPVIWFLIGILLLLLELVIPGLFIIFFSAGAWITALISLLVPIGVNLQILIFTVSSVVAVITLRKYLKRRFFSRDENDPESLLEEFIGKKGLAETDISPEKPGKVSFKGTLWNAESDVPIPKGHSVEIIGKESIILKVKPINPTI
jgi:membrane protein implicated in regulation of membrane protease activity